jgi:hypothetical protein
MKKLMIALLFFANIAFVTAQVDRTTENEESIQDKIQQEPPRPAQLNLERQSREEIKRVRNEKIEKKKADRLAKKKAKEKIKKPRS